MSVLIVTMPGDLHARAVQWAIEKLGGDVDILYPADLCAGARWTFDPARPQLLSSFGSINETIDFAKFKTVWMRRPQMRLPQDHMGDLTERASSEDDFQTLARSIYQIAESGRFAVNSVDRTFNAALKPYQFAVANEVGLNVPRTITGNQPSEILDFYRSCDERVVFKPFKSAIWQTARGPAMVPTTRLTYEMLQNADLGAAPGIFQEYIEKRSEVRATVMGNAIFAWEKEFGDRDDLDVDWRFMFKDAAHTAHQLPGEIQLACFHLMERLGLVFGCFDFVRNKDGEYFFLEVNPQGQWLWGDSLGCDLNQLEAMSEFLLQGSKEFNYSRRNKVSLAEYYSSIDMERDEAEERNHHGHLMTFSYSQVSFRVETALPNA